ncbi:Major Facilitator Superfamily protein [Streptomyces misionensis]|uniref:Major Facilitator Superfamily protein n=1 Tax=Streptomyces misionensis TaxID=67331 RepID=A0A1H5HRE9_9ACTN|nr:MFS transporter [Streptomyces misionensis]SEE30485.1 Major Facilitator Superfamily protein [Streptomyces misionensis]
MTIAATRPGTAPVPRGGAPNGTPGGRPSRALTAVYVAGAVTALGTQMTMLALPWLVLETTGSATRAGLVFAAQVLPMALLGFAGGEVIQRLGARRTMVVSDLARAPVVALIPLLQTLGALDLAVLVAIVAALGTLAVPYYAAQRVLAMELLSPHARSLARANSALGGVQNGSAFAGPALAGALIPLVGTTSVVWLDAATFAFSGLLLLRRVPAGGGGAGGSAAGPRGVWAGVRHLCGDWFLSRAMLSTVVFGLMLRTLMITMPVLAFARFDGDARVGGLLIAAVGAGGMVGSVAAYVLAARVAPVRLACTALVCVALPLWMLLVPAPAGVLVVAVGLSSAAVPLANAPLMGVLSARLPDGFGPKVLQAVITIGTLAGPLGFLAAGAVLDRAGVTAALWGVAALATFGSGNLILALRRLQATGDPD